MRHGSVWLGIGAAIVGVVVGRFLLPAAQDGLKQVKANGSVYYELSSGGHDYIVVGSVYDKTAKTDLTRKALVDMQVELAQAGAAGMYRYDTPEAFLLGSAAQAQGLMPPEGAAGEAEAMLGQPVAPLGSPLGTPMVSSAPVEAMQVEGGGRLPTVNGAEVKGQGAKTLARDNLAKIIGEIRDDKLVVYRAEGQERASVTVISSPDCPHCKTLHKDMDKLLRAGITVRYMLVSPPDRIGRSASALCEKDRAAAVNRLYEDRSAFVGAATCEHGGVLAKNMFETGAAMLRAVRTMGLQGGTPTLLNAKGFMSEGYSNADTLIAALLAPSGA